MNQSDYNPDDMDNESSDQLAVRRTKALLDGDDLSPDSLSAAKLYLMIRMTVSLAPSGMRPREAVEQVLSGLSAGDRKPLRSGLLKFYVCEGDLKEAAEYLPPSGKLAMSEYEPAMRVHLASGDLKAAKAIAKRCEKLIPVDAYEDDPRLRNFTELGLHMALAAYYARIGQRRRALDFWQYPEFTGRYYTEVVTGVSYSLVVEALYAAHRGIDELIDQQVHESFIFDRVSAADALGNRSQAIEALQKVRDDLLRILPPAQKIKFGVQADPCFKTLDRKGGN